MSIKDYYTLESSSIFNISPFEELKVDLVLKKTPPRYKTLLIGYVSSQCSSIINATVKILDLNFNPLFHTVTNKYGLFQFNSILAPGKYYVVASADNYNTSDTKAIQVKQYKISKCTLKLEKNSLCKNALLYGIIKDSPYNKCISNAKITLLNKYNNIVATTYTNASGEYLMYNIMPNEYILSVNHIEYMKLNSYPFSIDYGDEMKLNLYMIPNPLTENGTINGIIEFNNDPQPNIPVFLYKIKDQNNFEIIDMQMTNKEGIYLFSNVLPGKYILKSKFQKQAAHEVVIDLK